MCNFKKQLLLSITTILFLSFTSMAKKNEESFFNKTLYYLYQPIAFFLPHIEFRERIHEQESQYFHIVVEKDDYGRHHLVFLPRKGSQSIYDPAKPDKLISNFMKNAFVALPALGHYPKKVLFIGMGGGIMPMYLHRHYPKTQIDIVEIDKAVAEIAEKYFGFVPDPKIKIHIQDGRVFVNKIDNIYDLIFVDVYNAYNIPFQFTTIEFYQQLKRILAYNGVCAVNLANMGKKSFIAAELNTIYKVFPDTFVLKCPNNTNYVPIISKNKINYNRIKLNAAHFDKEEKFNINFEKLLKNKLNNKELGSLKQKSNLTLTDDYAPAYMMN